MAVYVHYGSDTYDPSLFAPIRNDGPAGGLWASCEGLVHEDGWMNYGWREWCEDNKIHTLNHFFRFKLKDGANVITLYEPADLLPLPKVKPWNMKDEPGTSASELMEYYESKRCFLDYERLAKDGVDAIELRRSVKFIGILWDYDAIFVMNPDVILPI